MEHELPLQRFKQALQAHDQVLEKLQSALLEFKESISSRETSLRPQEEEQSGGVQLLSIPQPCQELGMGKSWVYRRLRSGEIPSVRLGRSIKVRRDELEEYLQSHRYPEHQAVQDWGRPLSSGASSVPSPQDFKTWRTMVRQQSLSDEQAAELMTKMVRCVTRG
jgi:excisionase family DNA binding protein